MGARPSPLQTALGVPSRRLPESNRCKGHSSPDTVTGWIYVVEDSRGRVKIGWSRSPDERIRLLESKTGDYLHVWALISGTRADERRFHDRWAHRRVEGEWFRVSDGLLSWAADLDDESRGLRPEAVLATRGAEAS